MNEFELQLAYDRRTETMGRLMEQNEALTEQNEKLHKWNVEKEKRIAELSGTTVNGVAPYLWPPNRRTAEDSNEKAVSLMRQHVASYTGIDAHRHNCLDLCRRIETANTRILELEAENAALEADVLALARRLLFEPADSFAPESWEAMDRWRFEAMGGCWKGEPEHE